MKPKALLLSAYDADSHQHWRQAVTTMVNDYQWTHQVLPPRHFAWHVRGSSLIWYAQNIIRQAPDVVLATSTVDLNRLLGLHPELRRSRLVLYFHDNQFAYPRRSRQQGHQELQLASIYAAATADRLAFNSQFNQQTFLEGVQTFLDALPRNAPRSLVAQLEEKSQVLPVPMEMPPADGGRRDEPAGTPGSPPDTRALVVTWAARWEYDKGPENLLAIVRAMAARGFNFRLNVIGRQFRNSPDEFERLRAEFGDRLNHFGYLPERKQYWQVLNETHVFLSTAAHEFQGLAVLEATASGCMPMVPDALVYPEIYPHACRYRSIAEAVDRCEKLQADLPSWSVPEIDLRRFHPDRLRQAYRDLLAR